MVRTLLLQIGVTLCLWPALSRGAAPDGVFPRPAMEMLEDPGRSFTIEELVAHPESFAWRPVGVGATTFGYSESRFWFRFRLPGVAEALSRGEGFLVEVPNTYFSRLAFYGASKGRLFRRSITGMAVPVAARDPQVLLAGSPVFRVNTEALREEVDPVYYFSAESHFPIALPMNLYLYSAFGRAHSERMLLLGAFFGLLFLAIVFNAFLAVSLRSRLYGYYSLFVTCIMGLFLGHEGLSIQYLWPNSPWWALREMHVFGGLTLVFYALFIRELLGRRNSWRWLDRILVGLVSVSLLRTVWLLFSDSLLIGEIGEVAVTLTNLFVLVIGLVDLRRGVPTAKYFVAASACFNVSMVFYVLQAANLLQVGEFLNYAPHLGVALEVILLSLALADRIRATNRSLAEQRLASVHSEKLRALGRMAGEIAHEINNPLAIIHGNSVLMKAIVEDGGDLGQLSQSAATVEQTAMRISRIVKGMRALAKENQGEPMRESPLSTILQDAYALCAERARERNLELEFPTVRNEMILRCRASEISQVLVNLLLNAFDAVEGNARPWVRLEINQRPGHLELAVIDNGQGVPPGLRSRLLEPFFTTKEGGKGLGLGLSISRTIVEHHGGSLWLDEASPRTRFVFTVPQALDH